MSYKFEVGKSYRIPLGALESVGVECTCVGESDSLVLRCDEVDKDGDMWTNDTRLTFQGEHCASGFCVAGSAWDTLVEFKIEEVQA